MKRKAVPEIRSIHEEHKLYNEALKSNKPFLVINRADGYAGCEYDMETANCRLKSSAVDEITKLMNQSFKVQCQSHSLISHGNQVKMVNWFANANSGSMHPMRLKDSKILARQIRDIIMDPTNWKSIF